MGHQDDHLHAPFRGIAKCSQHPVVENQVWCHNVHIGVRGIDDVEINAFPDALIAERTGAVRNHIAVRFLVHIPFIGICPKGFTAPCFGIPHFEKHIGKPFDRLPYESDAGVLPMSEPFLLIDVFIRKIDASGKGSMSVDHQDLSVVSVVVVGGKDRADRREHSALNALTLEDPGIVVRQIEQHIRTVIHQAHLDSRLCFVHQNVMDGVPDTSVAHDEELQKNKSLRLFECFQHIRKLVVSEGIVFHARVTEDGTVILFQKIIPQLCHMRTFLMEFVQHIRVLCNRVFGLHGKLLQSAPKSLRAGLKENRRIKDSAEDRKHGNRHHPGKLHVRAGTLIENINKGKHADDSEQHIKKEAVFAQHNISFNQKH